MEPDLRQPVSVAVVGAGWAAAEFHLPYYKSYEKVDINSIVDYDKEKRNTVAEDFDVERTYQSTEDLFENEDVDIISICTPPNTHEQIAIEAFENECHVFCEKPLTISLESAKRIKDAVPKNKVGFVGYTPKFYKNYNIVSSILGEHLLGDLHSFKTIYYSPDPPSEWYFDPNISGSGVIADKLPHLLDYYIDLFGDPQSIRSKDMKIRDEVPVNVTIELEFEEVDMEIMIGWGHPEGYSKQIILGEYGNIEFNKEMIQGKIRGEPILFKNGKTPVIDLRLKQLYLSPEDDAYKSRMAAFLTSVSRGRNMASTSINKGVQIWELIDEVI